MCVCANSCHASTYICTLCCQDGLWLWTPSSVEQSTWITNWDLLWFSHSHSFPQMKGFSCGCVFPCGYTGHVPQIYCAQRLNVGPSQLMWFLYTSLGRVWASPTYVGGGCAWVQFLYHINRISKLSINLLITPWILQRCNFSYAACLCEPVVAKPEETEGRQCRSGGRQLQNRGGKRL